MTQEVCVQFSPSRCGNIEALGRHSLGTAVLPPAARFGEGGGVSAAVFRELPAPRVLLQYKQLYHRDYF